MQVKEENDSYHIWIKISCLCCFRRVSDGAEAVHGRDEPPFPGLHAGCTGYRTRTGIRQPQLPGKGSPQTGIRKGKYHSIPEGTGCPVETTNRQTEGKCGLLL